MFNENFPTDSAGSKQGKKPRYGKEPRHGKELGQEKEPEQGNAQEKTPGTLPGISRIQRLQEEIYHDIISSINSNLTVGNITVDDANQLIELANLLHEHICQDFKKKGGQVDMKPLLPGAIELPNDKYRLRIDKLEKQIVRYENKLTKYENELTKYENELTKYENEKSKDKEEIAKLKKRIMELEQG